MPKKPIGDNGPYKFGNGTVERQKITYPDDKVSQEGMITALFVEACQRQAGIVFSVQTLPEADHDGRLVSDAGEIDLQLKEIVLARGKGSPYETRANQYLAGDFADGVIELIERKPYAPTGRPLWLVLYSTHWAFNPAPPVKFLLHKYFVRKPANYAHVCVMEILAADHGEVTGLYPTVSGQSAQAILMFQDEADARKYWVNLSRSKRRRANRNRHHLRVSKNKTAWVTPPLPPRHLAELIAAGGYAPFSTGMHANAHSAAAVGLLRTSRVMYRVCARSGGPLHHKSSGPLRTRPPRDTKSRPLLLRNIRPVTQLLTCCAQHA
jgi:hypothetical protein